MAISIRTRTAFKTSKSSFDLLGPGKSGDVQMQPIQRGGICDVPLNIARFFQII